MIKVRVLIALCAVLTGWQSPAFSATTDSDTKERLAFFDQCLETTLQRTAWSPVKWQSLGTTFEQDIEKLRLRDAFAQADTPEKMRLATIRFFNARRDSHIALRTSRKGKKFAPIRFLPDLTHLPSPEKPMHTLPLFVANFTDDAQQQGIKRGDRLVAINNIPIDDYLAQFQLLAPASTLQNAYIRTAGWGTKPSLLAGKFAALPQHFFPEEDTAVFTLHDVDTNAPKTVTLNYATQHQTVENWALPAILGGKRQRNPLHYNSFYTKLGYTLIQETPDAYFWVKPDEKLAILEWFDFQNTQQNIDFILTAAMRHGALNYDLIIDATHASGGRDAWQLARVLSDKPFTPTSGNVRVNDKAFIQDFLGFNVEQGIRHWIQTALDKGDDYTSNAPFKLAYGDTIGPGETRFGGRKVLLLFPWGGSQVDQFAAMLCDNTDANNIDSMGTTMGGYSNTWEHSEILSLPGSDEKLIVAWNIGHTLRPNGEILEGNPARANIWLPMTPHNAGHYFETLIQRAETHLLNQ